MSRLSLGSLLFNWPAGIARDFYFRIAEETDFDRVYIGEVVCSKRAPLHAEYLPEAIDRLQKAGKQVILSTLALVMTVRELCALREITASDGDFMVEANDLSAVTLLKGKPFAAGPLLNIYNEGTLAHLENLGARIVSLPFELPGSAMKILASYAQAELEAQVFGRMGLAISARCYHARAHGLHKDNCQFVCENHTDGMDVQTLDKQEFLAVNGTQTLSFAYGNLLQEIPEMQRMGISTFRLSPHSVNMPAIAAIFRAVTEARISTEEGFAKLRAQIPGIAFANGFFYAKEGRSLLAPAA